MFYPGGLSAPDSLGLLLLRLVMGAAFLFHGWGKIKDPMGWMGPEAQIPATLQAAAAVAEFGGGAALVLGFLTRLGALGIAGVMIGALAIVHVPQGHPFVGQGASSELPAVYLACAALIALVGAGRFSLDAWLFGGARETTPQSSA
jgi:putative oxidoreductase